MVYCLKFLSFFSLRRNCVSWSTLSFFLEENESSSCYLFNAYEILNCQTEKSSIILPLLLVSIQHIIQTTVNGRRI